MLTPKPLAAAIAALALACAGTAAADDRRKNEIEVWSYSFGTTTLAPAVAGDFATPAPEQQLPAVQGVREAAAQSTGANEPIAVHGTRTETDRALPLTPLDDARLKGRSAPEAASRDVLLGGHTVDTAPKGQNALRSGPRTGEQKYFEWKLKEVLISGVIQNGNDAAPAQQRYLDVPPPNPAPSLKLDGIDAKPAIAINTPLRTLPNRSPVADGSSNTLMTGEKSPRPAPAVAGPARR